METRGGDTVPEASDAQAILRENLKDAGCSPDMIRRCEILAHGKKEGELLQVLSLHRRALLNAVHESERRIDRLDYLIYQIEKRDKRSK